MLLPSFQPSPTQPQPTLSHVYTHYSDYNDLLWCYNMICYFPLLLLLSLNRVEPMASVLLIWLQKEFSDSSKTLYLASNHTQVCAEHQASNMITTTQCKWRRFSSWSRWTTGHHVSCRSDCYRCSMHPMAYNTWDTPPFHYHISDGSMWCAKGQEPLPIDCLGSPWLTSNFPTQGKWRMLSKACTN